MIFAQNKKIGSSFTERTNVFILIDSLISSNNVSTDEFKGANNTSTLKPGIIVSRGGLSEIVCHISKHIKNGKGKRPKRDITVDGFVFSCYLDHNLQHLRNGSKIKCNQILLNGNRRDSLSSVVC